MRLPPAASVISSASARIPGRCGTSSMLKLDSHRDQLDHVTCNPLSMEMCSMVRIPPPKMRGSMAHGAPHLPLADVGVSHSLFQVVIPHGGVTATAVFRELLKACGSRLYGSGW